MTPALGPAGRARLRSAAAGRTLIALDFDGTLSPITRWPDRATMRALTRRLLKDLARLYPVVVVSGRARPDVARRLGPARVEVIGNHGAEGRTAPTGIRQVIARARAALTPVVRRLPGVTLENKGYSLALHYRRAANRRDSREKLLGACRALRGVRVFPGKCVLNVVALGAPHKGTAVDAARRRLGCHTVVFVGDDETDENVFRTIPRGRLLGIRVGRMTGSHAEFYVHSQRDVNDLLETLIRLRAPDSGDLSAMALDPEEPALGATLEFMRLMWGLDHALQKRSKWMASHQGVTGPQRLALRIIGRMPTVSAGRLAETLKIHPSTLTGVLQRLERGGFVTRRLDRGDRRRIRLELTARGRAITKTSSGSIEAAVGRVLQRVEANDLQASARVLRALVETLEDGMP